jgi:hypothetical protein
LCSNVANIVAVFAAARALAFFITSCYNYTTAVAENCRTSPPQQAWYLGAIILSDLLLCAFSAMAAAEIGGGKRMVQALRQHHVGRPVSLTTLVGVFLATQLALCATTVAVWVDCHSAVHMVALA